MNKPYFKMLVGLPGSGKSTLAQNIKNNNPNTIICSSDAIRKEIFGDINNQEHNDEVFKILHKNIKENLKQGINVVMDATNLNSKRRRTILSELKNIPCIKECLIVAIPFSECCRNNELRERKVPDIVMRKMYLNWNTPYWFEGWDTIALHNNIVNYNDSIYNWINENIKFNQDNPHHCHSLGEHCKRVGDKLSNVPSLYYAGLLHDCGKPFTKSFINSKGEKTDIAHYYNHQNIGAYDSLFFDIPWIYKIDVSILINLHMTPYFWEKDIEHGEKTRLKYQKLWGQKLYENVMTLHLVDKYSH